MAASRKLSLYLVLLAFLSGAQANQSELLDWQKGRGEYVENFIILERAALKLTKQCFNINQKHLQTNYGHYHTSPKEGFLIEDQYTGERALIVIGTIQLRAFPPEAYIFKCAMDEVGIEIDARKTYVVMRLEENFQKLGASLFQNKPLLNKNHESIQKLMNQ